jgi:hypothetical protein
MEDDSIRGDISQTDSSLINISSLQGRVPPHIGSALDSIRTCHFQTKDRIRRLTNMLKVMPSYMENRI